MLRSSVFIAIAFATLSFIPGPASATGPLVAVLSQSPDAQVSGVVGSNPVVTPPELIHQATPKYPRSFFGKAAPADVRVSLVVGEDGVPKQVKVVNSGGEKFDKSALAAVSQYRFKPAEKDGHAIAVSLFVEVKFRAY